MKQLILALFALLMLASCEKETLLNEAQTPAEITAYTKLHFPNNPIVQVVEDKDDFSRTFDVILKDGILLEFNSKKEIISVESTQRKALPDSVIPASVLAYVKAEYPNQIIIKWELDNNQQEVTLDNRMELVFSKAGEFLYLDID